MLDKVANQTEVLNYPEAYGVNAAGRWKERLRNYPGRSHGRGEMNFGTTVEIRFVMRSQQTP